MVLVSSTCVNDTETLAIIYESIGSKGISDFSHNHLWTRFLAGSLTCDNDLIFHKQNNL